MSTSGPIVARDVRKMFNDADVESIIGDDELRLAINKTASMMSSEDNLSLGAVWLSPAFTLAPPALVYYFPTGVEYQSVQVLRFSSDKRQLFKRPRLEIEAMNQGSVSPARPSLFYLEQTSDQRVEVGIPGPPKAAEAVEALVSTTPADWESGPATAPAIPFSTRATNALKLLVAATVGSSLSKTKIVSLDVNPSVFELWHNEGMDLLRLDRLTIIRLKRAKGPASWAWFDIWRGA